MVEFLQAVRQYTFLQQIMQRVLIPGAYIAPLQAQMPGQLLDICLCVFDFEAVILGQIRQ